MENKDPFRSSVNVSERLQALKSFNLSECYHALVYTSCLQESTRKALVAKIRKLEATEPAKAPCESVSVRESPCPSVPAFTPGPWNILLEGTCSGTWPHIVTSDDPDGDNPVAELNTCFTEKNSVRKKKQPVGSYSERPENFEVTADHDEIIANAYLISASPDMYCLLASIRSALDLFAGETALEIVAQIDATLRKARGEATK